MSKRASLDTDQFNIEFSEKPRDPLDTVIPTSPPVKVNPPTKTKEQLRKHDSKQASRLSSYHDSMIESIRKSLRFIGKDAFFGRFTPEEKRMLADLCYTYKRNGFKTSENEIARIAVNFIVADYEENGKNSLLERVLKALNS
jgi:hypothetical protein